MIAPVKSVVAHALAVACPTCQVPIGAPCLRADNTPVEFKGHVGVHGERLWAARHVKKGAA